MSASSGNAPAQRRRTNAFGMTQPPSPAHASGIFLLASSALASPPSGFASAVADELSAGDEVDAALGSSALGVLEPQPARRRRDRTMQVRMPAPYHFIS